MKKLDNINVMFVINILIQKEFWTKSLSFIEGKDYLL